MTAAEQLRAARNASGLSQSQAARLTGIPVRTLQNWESGHRKPPDYVLQSVLARLTPSPSSVRGFLMCAAVVAGLVAGGQGVGSSEPPPAHLVQAVHAVARLRLD